MSKLIKVNCENCNKQIERYLSWLKRTKRIFCSKECSASKQSSENTTEITCNRCNKKFRRPNCMIRVTGNYCNNKCRKEERLSIKCYTCDKEIFRKPYDIDKNKFGQFCNRECYYKVVNSLGFSKRSKFELYVEDNLKKDFPTIDFKFNNTEILEQIELDIFSEKLNLGIEINGPHHYENFFGDNHLKKMQGRDKYKRKLCYEKDIELFVLNISNMKTKEYELFYNEIKNKVAQKLSII